MRNWEPMKKHPNIYVYETKKGKRYGVRTRYKKPNGKFSEWTKSGFSSWRDADVALKRFEVDLANGLVGKIEGRNVTLDAYFTSIYERKVKLNIWRPITARSMKNYYNRWFKKPFGKDNLQDISRQSYQAFLDDISTKGLAELTIKRIDSVMQMIMNDAETNDVIFKNKLRHMNINGQSPKSQSLSKEDYEKFMSCAKEHLTRYNYCMIYMLTLGERRSELMGLKKSSFKFEYDEKAKREICAITFETGRTTVAKKGGPLKTPSAYRTIWVYGEIVDMIKEAIEYSDSILKNKGMEVTPDHFLWLNPTTAKPYHPAQPSTLMKRLSERSGIKVHPHLLRHYFATRAMANRMSNTETMHWLGHANIQQTADYTRASKDGALDLFSGVEDDIKN
ncbi:tyrosine-type recombinase/integrase [Lentilactobacillus senioris]|uniref:tyrosine-type recombinase/integrase n=1 Tax=Lentilactobacillus senioris TaxID=931534 RepID=UPI00227E03CC|nr:tyrosine-type recombinase/integrase [Lentilactobacillus senioris]MCY9806523.1 tyrosine-type recombinase/integrase [Lentilactobacillus senioris]